MSSANLTPVFALRLSLALHHPNALNGQADGLRWPELLAPRVYTQGVSVRNARVTGLGETRVRCTQDIWDISRPSGKRSGVTLKVSRSAQFHTRDGRPHLNVDVLPRLTMLSSSLAVKVGVQAVISKAKFPDDSAFFSIEAFFDVSISYKLLIRMNLFLFITLLDKSRLSYHRNLFFNESYIYHRIDLDNLFNEIK